MNETGKELIRNLIKAYSDIGIEAKVVAVPTDRSIKGIRKNLYDAELARVLPVIEKYNLLYVKVPLFILTFCAYSKDDTNIPLEEAVVVYQRGIKQLNTLKFKKRIILNDSLHTIRFFSKREVADYMLGSDLVLGDFLNQKKYEHIKCKKVISTMPIYHIVAEKHRHLLPKLNKNFKKYFPLQ